MNRIDTVIVGGGQAGLAASYYLTQTHQPHVVLEQSKQAAAAWRGRSWDSFTLVTPNSIFRMPGVHPNDSNPDGFMPLNEVVQFFENYVDRFRLPVEYETRAESIAMANDGEYLVETNKRPYKAKHVVVATGLFQQPKIPAYAKNLPPQITQLHSSQYRNERSIPEGAVLIVGSGQSGCQIAEELNNAGRKVFLSTGTACRVPRRYRGKDIIEWLERMGFFDLTPEQLPPGMGKFDAIPHLSGTKGGHTINLHQFAHDGITLLGHLREVADNAVSFAPDLYQNLKIMDQFEAEVIDKINGYIQAAGIDAPPEQLVSMDYAYQQPLIERLDLKENNINTVIWATGYRFDYSFVKLPVFDNDGFPIQQSGVTKYPGLYFLGMPWMPSEKSGFFAGVGESARRITEHIATPLQV